MQMLGARAYLYRWNKHWQVDVRLRPSGGWYSFGWCWKRWCGMKPHPVLYRSLDATPATAQGWTHKY